jgi:hypothetical protein
MVMVAVVLAGTLTATAYASNTSNLNNTDAVTLPSAESVYLSETGTSSLYRILYNINSK